MKTIILTLLLVPMVVFGQQSASACDSYTWNDSTYTQSGNYYDFFQLGADIDGEAAYDQSGRSVSLSSDGMTVAIGATANDGNGTNSGHVRIYNYDGNSWNQLGADIDGEATNDRSGTSVSLSSDGLKLAIGAVWNDGNGSSSGHVRIYSTVTLDLTINNSTTGTDVITACDSYTWIDGNTYTTSNNAATHTLTNAAGCDSTVTLDLTINNSTTGTDVITACDSYTWIDGNTYTSSNNSATFLTTNSAGCDSIITLDLTINTPSLGTDVQEICSGDEYTWIDGNIYTEPNDSATYTMVGNNGCDSIVTLNLSVISVPEPTIVQNGNMLSCDNCATAYQWLDCDDNYAPIEGATDIVFTASQNGSYALEITFDACSDTSDCYDIDFVGISETNFIPKQIIKIIDLMGRETSFKPNTPLIYVYDDGSIKKVFSVEY